MNSSNLSLVVLDCGYLTKNEAGISLLLKAINEDATFIKDIDKINALASVLDKNREV